MAMQQPPALTVVNKVLQGIPLLNMTIWHVDMGEWAFTEHDVLATNGAGPCLNVVVHNSQKMTGCLSHIPHSTSKQDVLYDEACQTILQMIQKCVPEKQTFVVWIGSGWAFFPGNQYTPYQTVAQDFKDYLNNYLAQQGCSNYIIKDSRTSDPNDPGAVIYLPTTGTVLVPQRSEQGAIGLISNGKRPGFLSTFSSTVKRPDR